MSLPAKYEPIFEGEQESKTNAPRVLIIEDDESSRFLLQLYLQNELNVEIVSASGVEEGKIRFTQSHADLIVCDQNMGDGLGTDVLEYIRQINQTIPFVLFTSDKRDDLPNIDAFECCYVQKPGISELIEEVARRLGGVNGYP